VRVPLQLGLSLALAGCGGATTPAPMETPGATAIVIGTGVDSFTPFVDGQMAQVIHGPQGGYHVITAVLAHGIWPGTADAPTAPDDPTTTLRAFRASGAEFEITGELLNVFHSPYQAMGDGAWLGDRFLRFMIQSPTEIAGERLLLRAEVVDRDGKMASDEKHVIAVPPTN
jgi:hypothetical protein